MTDRELLELAAKAAGHEFLYFAPTLDGSGEYLRIKDLPDRWNPLADDGDALRLAVTLGLSVHVSLHAKETHVYGPHGFAGEVHNDDTYAATRRAIVRAAAEIGKGMT